MAVLITLTITDTITVTIAHTPVTTATFAVELDANPSVFGSLTRVSIRFVITAAYRIVVSRTLAWRDDTLANLATVADLFSAELVAVTVGAAVAGNSVPTSIARRRIDWASQTVSNTALRPTVNVTRWIWAHIGAVGRRFSHGVLAKRAPTVGTVAFVTALG
jgi:hypothetical protein